MSQQQLKGKVALVTGSGRGIGAAIASRLAGLGAVTVLCGRTQSHIDQTACRIAAAGGRGEAIACDVSNWTSVTALAARVQQSFGRLDILVNNEDRLTGCFDSVPQSRALPRAPLSMTKGGFAFAALKGVQSHDILHTAFSGHPLHSGPEGAALPPKEPKFGPLVSGRIVRTTSGFGLHLFERKSRRYR